MAGRSRALIALVVLALAAAACGGGAPREGPAGGKPLKRVSFIFSWKYSGHRAPYLLAKEKGFFRDEGLDVAMQEGIGSDKAVDLLATGRVDFAEVEFPTLIVARQQGRPIQTVATILQKSPQCLVSWQDSGIRSPKDLEGKRLVAVSGASDTQMMLGPLFSINGVSQDKVKIVYADFNTRDQIFQSHRADAMPTFINDTFVSLQKKGNAVDCLLYADFGVDLIGNGVAVNSSLVSKDPDTIRAFLKGLRRGWEYSVQHPDETIDALLKVAPLLQRDEELAKLEATVPLTKSDLGWGQTSPERARRNEELLIQAGMVKGPPKDVSGYFTNQFVG